MFLQVLFVWAAAQQCIDIRASTLPLLAGLFAGLYPLIMEDPGASGWLTFLQSHAQLPPKSAATGIIQHILVKERSGPRMPLTGQVQC